MITWKSKQYNAIDLGGKSDLVVVGVLFGLCRLSLRRSGGCEVASEEDLRMIGH
jgi:hypothetical protein